MALDMRFVGIFIVLLALVAAPGSSASAAPPAANSCPQLAGRYFCVFDSYPGYSPLVVTQESRTDSRGEVTAYSVTYTAISSDPDVIEANATGLQDDFGWVTRCAGNRLLSVTLDGSMMSETLLVDGAWVQRVNGKTTQSCSGSSGR